VTRPGLLIVFLSALAGCGRYADFTLPAPDPDGPRPPFRWEASPHPVLERGTEGEWDAVDVLNPSVVAGPAAYLNLYSGFDGRTWHTGIAISQDEGAHWLKTARTLSPSGWEGSSIAANGSALEAHGSYFYWYQAGDPVRIGLAQSSDKFTWTKLPKPVLEPGPRGSFDERGAADPYVIHSGAYFYMYYLGEDRAQPTRQRLGIARSTDGIRWEKSRSNPILELGGPGAFDEMGLGEPAVWTSGGSYWMLYTGRARGEQRRIGLAKSTDGIHWERDPEFPPITGDQPWNSHVMCDPSVEVKPDGIRVWFGGGNVARPDQNIHGQIGMGFLHGAATLKK
jgi:predicted GH43/DUF377 family glycosyl hydrolase